MKLNTENLRADFRNHFGVNGEVEIKPRKHPRKDEVQSFTFCDNIVKKGDSFFREIQLELGC